MPVTRLSHQPSGGPPDAAASLEDKLKYVEHRLAVVTAERNDLAADVEALCMQSSGDIFSASGVLSERICNLSKEANRLHSQAPPAIRAPYGSAMSCCNINCRGAMTGDAQSDPAL